MTRSLGSVLDRQKGFGPGFDFARVFLAFSVLLWHSFSAVDGQYGEWNDRLWVYNYSILPMFFALSGFLIAGSAQRLSLANFLLNRGLRIIPALLVEIVLSAFLLGPLVTASPLGIYFTSPKLPIYFLNIIGYIHYRLPGVFLDNPNPDVVNGSLWTVPFEIVCYAVMAGLMLVGALKRRWMLFAAAFGVCALGLILSIAAGAYPHVRMLLALNHDGKGAALLPCFLFGVLSYMFRYRIPFEWRIFAVCIAAMTVVDVLITPERWQFGPSLLAAPVLAYIVIFVGLTEVPRIPYFWRGDYSYGIYLYGFPIQQTLIHFVPTLKNVPLFFVASALCTTALASLSWSYVEKPILRLRRNFSFVSRKQHDAEVSAISPTPAASIGEPLS